VRQPSGTQFIPALSGLRAIAALAVLGMHLSSKGLLPRVFVGARTGELGVMLFFCLSGLLMANLYLRHEATPASLWRFVRARFARIFPLFAVVVIGSALIYHFDSRFPFHLDALDAAKHLLLFGSGTTIWSISVEFQFYAAFIALWLLYAALPDRYRESGLVVVCIGVILALWTLGYPGGRIAITHYGQIFLIGVLAAMIFWHAPEGLGRAASLLLPVLLALDVTTALVLGPSEYDCYRSTALLVLTGAIVLCGAAGQGFFAERILGSRSMVYLGEISFGLYLLQKPAIYFWKTLGVLLGLHLHGNKLLVLILATLLVAAHLAYRFIEQPARRALTRDHQDVSRKQSVEGTAPEAPSSRVVSG
jgi:peptidoglycan/LPS O-acetylase OafA/YrhL